MTNKIGSVWVLGSTSTVAIAICRHLAEHGCRRFHLLARNFERNQALFNELRECFEAEVSFEKVDLPATEPPEPLLRESFDLYLVAAGSLGDAERARNDASEAQAITQTNFTGLIPWLTAIVSPERINYPGALWVFSSVAADRGRPSNYTTALRKQACCASAKACYCAATAPFAIRILKAGFIASPMPTDGKAPPVLCAKPEQIAHDLLRKPFRRGIETIPVVVTTHVDCASTARPNCRQALMP